MVRAPHKIGKIKETTGLAGNPDCATDSKPEDINRTSIRTRYEGSSAAWNHSVPGFHECGSGIGLAKERLNGTDILNLESPPLTSIHRWHGEKTPHIIRYLNQNIYILNKAHTIV